MKIFIRLLISILLFLSLIVAYYSIIQPFYHKYQLVYCPAFRYFTIPFDLLWGCIWFNRGGLLLGFIAIYIVIIYLAIAGFERLYKKMQISLGRGIVILGGFVFGICFVSYLLITSQAGINQKKAQLYIEAMLPKIKEDVRFGSIRMYASSGILEIFGDFKKETELEDLTDIIFSSVGSLKVVWSIRCAWNQGIEWDHELKQYRLKWEEKYGKKGGSKKSK